MVSAGTKYGLRFAAELAASWGAGAVDAASVAERRAIPEAYLRKIAAALRRAGLVEADRGQSGGYRLSRHPASISAAEIFDALETPAAAPAGSGDPADRVWSRMEEAARGSLEQENLEELARTLAGVDSWMI
jgi:Rrf2 family cysteine metabolism transcriptional repressor